MHNPSVHTESTVVVRHRVRVLVAEDSTCMQRGLRAILKHLGAEIDIVGNGQLACELAEKSKSEDRPYDLILMDMQMPQMNGFKATKWLRENGWKAPIVALSAYDTPEQCQQILDAGCDGYATKPFNEKMLREIFAQYLPRAS